MKAYLHRNGQAYGPYPEESLRGFLESGHADPSDLAFAIGAEEWIRLSDLIGMEGEGAEEETQGEALDDQEILEYAEKIKTLVKSGEEELAIDMVRSLNEPKLYSELLKDCSIDQDSYKSYERGDLRLPDWLWNDEEGHDSRPFFLLLIQYCPEDAEIHPSLRKENLTNLNLAHCTSLTNADCLSGLTNLTKLKLSWCFSLMNLDGLSELTNLTSLTLGECTSLTNVDGLSELTNLTSLDLCGCDSLTNVDGLSGLTSLTELRLQQCTSLTNLDALSNLTNLTDLNLWGCESLTNVDCLSGLTNLTTLFARCTSLTNVDVLSGLTNLTSLNLSGCSSLRNVDVLSGLTNLTDLDLNGCESLTNDQVDELRNALPECEISF